LDPRDWIGLIEHPTISSHCIRHFSQAATLEITLVFPIPRRERALVLLRNTASSIAVVRGFTFLSQLPKMLLLLCFSRAQAAHVLEATHPHSRTPTQSYEFMPIIPPNPPHLSTRVVCAARSAFDLFDVQDNMTVRTTCEGFTTRLRIGDRTTTTPYNCEPHTFEGVTLTSDCYMYVENGVIFTFKLRNGGGQTQWVNLQIADIGLTIWTGRRYSPYLAVAASLPLPRNMSSR
jgi:hypothetical protein